MKMKETYTKPILKISKIKNEPFLAGSCGIVGKDESGECASDDIGWGGNDDSGTLDPEAKQYFSGYTVNWDDDEDGAR